jgi:hypothetical protein
MAMYAGTGVSDITSIGPAANAVAASLIDHARDHRASMHIESDSATFAHNRRLP